MTRPTPIRGCTLPESDRLLFEIEFFPQAFASDVLAANQRSYEQRLASLGMICSIDDPTQTAAGMLTLSKSPRNWIACACIQFLRMQGTAFADPVVDVLKTEGTNAPVRMYGFDGGPARGGHRP